MNRIEVVSCNPHLSACYHAYCKLELLLKKAGLNKKITPLDLIFEFSKVYYINFGESGKVMEIPKKIRDIEAKLGSEPIPYVMRS
jgi:hypothetical protein